MAEVNCSRCGRAAAGLERVPLPGPIGQSVFEQTCSDCWKEWLRAQVIVINERRLSPANSEHFEQLLGEMKTFLDLNDG